MNELFGEDIYKGFTEARSALGEKLRGSQTQLTVSESESLAESMLIGGLLTASGASSLKSLLKTGVLKIKTKDGITKLESAYKPGDSVDVDLNKVNKKVKGFDSDTKKLNTDTSSGFAKKISDEILTFTDKNAARTSLEGTVFFKEGNKFFKDATGKCRDYTIENLANGNKQMSFFAPANSKGYGKKYIMELDKSGNKISDYKQTIDPKGNILNTKLTGE